MAAAVVFYVYSLCVTVSDNVQDNVGVPCELRPLNIHALLSCHTKASKLLSLASATER